MCIFKNTISGMFGVYTIPQTIHESLYDTIIVSKTVCRARISAGARN